MKQFVQDVVSTYHPKKCFIAIEESDDVGLNLEVEMPGYECRLFALGKVTMNEAVESASMLASMFGSMGLEICADSEAVQLGEEGA